MDLVVLLAVVARWATRCGLDEMGTATAQSLAWLWASKSEVNYPAGHWAKLAVRATRNGRDLPGCGTGHADALMHSTQGAGMGDMKDKSPGPDALAAHREQWERMESGLDERRRLAVEMRLEGWSNFEIATALGVSPGRTSQMAREVMERFYE